MSKKATHIAGTSGSSGKSCDDLEPNWGNPEKSQVRMDTTTKEKVAGIIWLTIGILFGLFVEIIYRGARITVGDVAVPIPWVVVFAFFFNRGVTRTATLWTKNRTVAGIPLVAWLVCLLLLMAWPRLPFGASVFVPSTLTAGALILAGLIGGLWPLWQLIMATLNGADGPGAHKV